MDQRLFRFGGNRPPVVASGAHKALFVLWLLAGHRPREDSTALAKASEQGAKSRG